MSLIIKQIIEVAEYVDVWGLLEEPLNLQELTDDETKQAELSRIVEDRTRLEHQCAHLKALFPHRDSFYDGILAQQIHDLEDIIRKLLPNTIFE